MFGLELVDDFAIAAAAVLGAIHFFGHHIRGYMRKHGEIAASFGGGIALAYVFLQVLPEINRAHDWFGDEVHAITLISFLGFYTLEAWLARERSYTSQAKSTTGRHRVFWFHIGLSAVYTAMVIFAMPHDVSEQLLFAVLGSVAIGLHLIYKDFVLRSHHGEDYELKGRMILAAAPFVGLVLHDWIEPPEVLFDLFIAVLAGFLFQSVFREELPGHANLRIRWLLLGAGVYWVLVATLH